MRKTIVQANVETQLGNSLSSGGVSACFLSISLLSTQSPQQLCVWTVLEGFGANL